MKYILSFNGTCEIEAPTEGLALDKFWEYINAEESLPSNLYKIDNWEEKEED